MEHYMTTSAARQNRILEMVVHLGWGIRKSMAVCRLGEQLPLLQASLHDEDPELCMEWTSACRQNIGEGMLMLAQQIFLLSRYETLTLRPVANYDNGRLTVTDRNGQSYVLLIRTELQQEVLSVLGTFVLSINGDPEDTLALASQAAIEHKYFLGNLVSEAEMHLSLQGGI
jgi:hypothetical protein